MRKIDDALVLDYIFVLQDPDTEHIYVVRVEKNAEGEESATPIHFNSATEATNEELSEAVGKAI